MDAATLLQRRRRSVRLTKEEILLMLRAYQQHPTRWADVIDEIKENINQLSPQTVDLYNTAGAKQLKDRLSTKLAKLIANRNIQDADIRNEVENIRVMERRLVQGRPNNEPQAPQQDEGQQVDDVNGQADGEDADQRGANRRDDVVQDQHANDEEADQRGANRGNVGVQDRRDAIAQALSDSDSSNDDVQPPPRRRRRLADLIRENHELYNDFMKRKLPRIMRDFGMDSDDN